MKKKLSYLHDTMITSCIPIKITKNMHVWFLFMNVEHNTCSFKSFNFVLLHIKINQNIMHILSFVLLANWSV